MKKITFIVLTFVLTIMLSCVSGPANLGWVTEDFQAYAAESGDNTFKIDYICVSLDFHASQYAEYFDSSIYFDPLPVREIAELFEQKYGVDIDTSFYRNALNKGRLKLSAEKTGEYSADEMGIASSENTGGLGLFRLKEGEIMNDSFLWRQTFRGGKVVYDYNIDYLKIPKGGDYMYLVWGGESGLYKPENRNWNWTGSFGKMNQMQILIYVDEPKNVKVSVRLCVPQGEPLDESGFYNMGIGVEHTVTVFNDSFQADEESMNKIADALSKTAELLAVEMQ
jgi:hypothetical protein